MAALSGRAQNSDGQAAVYNIVSGGVMGGIGAMINKRPGEKTFKVFLKGASQGAVGGYVVFESKRLLRNFSRTGDYAYVWPSRILNSAGNSMVRNAASNRDLWERWHINIGFNHFEYDLKRERKFRYRILPFALAGVTEGFVKGSLDMEKSLLTGHFIFRSRENSPDYIAQTFVNSIKYDEDHYEERPSLIAHEIVHAYQYEGYFAFNSFLDKPIAKIEENNGLVSLYGTFFYTDFNYLVFSGGYGLANIFSDSIFDNIYEKEANYYEEFYGR